MNDLISSLVGISRHRRLMTNLHVGKRKVNYVLDLDEGGRIAAVSNTVQGDDENKPKRFAVPREYSLGSTNEAPGNFFCAKGKHWFPSDQDFASSPVWQALERAIQANKTNTLLLTLDLLGRRLRAGETIKRILEVDPCQHKASGQVTGDKYLSFRVMGRFLWQDESLGQWWRREYKVQRKERVHGWQTGNDFFSVGKGKMAEAFPTIMGNVPLASFDKSPFQSYGLGGRTTMMRLSSAERAATTIDELLDRTENHFWLGKESVFLFWAEAEAANCSSSPNETDFISLLNTDDALQIKDYFNGVWGHRAPVASGKFHAVLFSRNQNRAVVRSWLTESLSKIEKNVQWFFDGIQLQANAVKAVTLKGLASCLLPVSENRPQDPLPHQVALFVEHSLNGRPLPITILNAVLHRQIAEMTNDTKPMFFERLQQRTACIKLYIRQGGEDMSETIHLKEENAAYYCGRLLAILGAIHDHAHNYPKSSASSPACKYYAAASKTPALTFPRLLTLAQYHLAKMNSNDRQRMEFGVCHGDAEKELTGLAEMVAKFNGDANANFPRILELEDQGRFAIGFYFERQRCQRWKYILGGTERN